MILHLLQTQSETVVVHLYEAFLSMTKNYLNLALGIAGGFNINHQFQNLRMIE